MCRLTAEEKTWEHARRKRRLAQHLALKKLKNIDGECVKTNVNAEETLDTVPVAKEENLSEEMLSVKKEENGGSSSKCVPLLTCELWVEIGSSESEETVTQDDVFRIWMIFENGSGGLEALQSLRQYLINRLGLKKTHNPSKPVKKRRKRTKKSSGEGAIESLNRS